jgi:hypothetical protein
VAAREEPAPQQVLGRSERRLVIVLLQQSTALETYRSIIIVFVLFIVDVTFNTILFVLRRTGRTDPAVPTGETGGGTIISIVEEAHTGDRGERTLAS